MLLCKAFFLRKSQRGLLAQQQEEEKEEEGEKEKKKKEKSGGGEAEREVVPLVLQQHQLRRCLSFLSQSLVLQSVRVAAGAAAAATTAGGQRAERGREEEEEERRKSKHDGSSSSGSEERARERLWLSAESERLRTGRESGKKIINEQAPSNSLLLERGKANPAS